MEECLVRYEEWKSESLKITSRSHNDIDKLVKLLNDYKNYVEPVFDGRKNSAQEVLQPSILEEFFEYLFCTIKSEIGIDLLRSPARGYVDLIFNPSDTKKLVEAPQYTIRRKDHDFVIGATAQITIQGQSSKQSSTESIVIPALAIECKRYLERNMLDECAGTAAKVKSATPYCKYFVVAEYLKMDNASPEISLIDEIYVLRRQRNSERLSPDFKPKPIHSDLIIDLYERCMEHIRRVWWHPESALEIGKVFNFD
jgi:hypothetical protein